MKLRAGKQAQDEERNELGGGGGGGGGGVSSSSSSNSRPTRTHSADHMTILHMLQSQRQTVEAPSSPSSFTPGGAAGGIASGGGGGGGSRRVESKDRSKSSPNFDDLLGPSLSTRATDLEAEAERLWSATVAGGAGGGSSRGGGGGGGEAGSGGSGGGGGGGGGGSIADIAAALEASDAEEQEELRKGESRSKRGGRQHAADSAFGLSEFDASIAGVAENSEGDSSIGGAAAGAAADADTMALQRRQQRRVRGSSAESGTTAVVVEEERSQCWMAWVRVIVMIASVTVVYFVGLYILQPAGLPSPSTLKTKLKRVEL